MSRTAAAAWLLVPMPVGAVVFLALVQAKLVPANALVASGLGIFPLAALVVAGTAGARALIAGALIEIGLLVPLHGLVTFIRAWRLEGG